MVIGIDASRANRKQKTGTEWYSFYLIANLARLDQKNKYLLYLNTTPSMELQAVIRDNPNFSCKILNWPFFSFWTLGRLSLEMIFNRPEVLFIPAHTLPLFFPRKTVNTIHDIAFVREQNLYLSEKVKTSMYGSRPLINFIVKILTRGKYRAASLDYLYWSTTYALRRAKKIITVSEFTKQEILSLYPKTKEEKIAVVHNGYNKQLYQPLNSFDDKEKIAAVLDKYGLEAPYYLYVGRLEKKKNTPALIESLSLVRENNPEIKEKLLLIGNASFGYDEAKYVIEEYNLNNDVFMPGWVAEDDLPYIFNGASAFIFPTKHEGFGIPVLQALACGLPTAVSDLPVLREISGDAVLYFDQNKSRAIADAMVRIIKDEALRQDLKQKGLEQVEDFSWEKCAAETLQVLENL